MPVLSIIIPAYNSAKYINRCLDSIFSQENELDIEVICVNDGSSDDTLSLLKKYQIREPRLKVFDQPNSGASAARNAGISLANGEWIMFVDSDDYVSRSFGPLVTEAIKNSVDFAVSGLYRISRSDIQNCTRLRKAVFKSEEMYNIVLRTDTLSLGSPCCKIFKTEIVRQYGILFHTDLKLFEDAVFVYNYLLHCTTAMTSDIVFYCYDVKEVSTGGNYHGDVFWKCLDKYVDIQNCFVDKFAHTQEEKKMLLAHHADSNNYNMLYAFYAIYRCENRPRKKYSALKSHISNYERVTGG